MKMANLDRVICERRRWGLARTGTCKHLDQHQDCSKKLASLCLHSLLACLPWCASPEERLRGRARESATRDKKNGFTLN